MPFTTQPALQATTRQLAQVRPANTNNTDAYSPADGVTTEVETIIVCNHTGASINYRIFHDEDGTTYTQATALYFDVPLAANTTAEITFPIYMNDPAGFIGVRSSTGDGLTFTLYGKEIQVRAR